MQWVPLLLSMVLCAGCLSCTIWENPPKGWAGATGGEQLERQLWREIAQQNWPEVERHLATNFTLAVPNGFLGPGEAMQYWKQLQLQDYSLGDFKIKPNGADVTVAYTAVVHGTRQGEPVSADPMHVMSLWQEVGGRWVLIAQSVHPAQPAP
jgi:hypothetical protein